MSGQPDEQGGSRCLGCGGPLRERQGLNTCDSPKCPGNLNARLDAFWRGTR